MPDCITSSQPRSLSSLPQPDHAALLVSQQLQQLIRNEIDHDGAGQMPFDHYMELALYAPGLGYYVAGSRKFGELGDFVTAPEISPLFAQCLARQAREVMDAIGGGDILEFGAGSGLLAADLLLELKRLASLPERYFILEVSPELRQRQHETLQQRAPDLIDRVEWLEYLPTGFQGLVVANELLDAMPVSRFRIASGVIEESFVTYDDEGFREIFLPSQSAALLDAVQKIEDSVSQLAEGYVSEVNLRQAAWIKSLSAMLEKGAVLLVDYGYSQSEYYHPQRNTGTLMCHYRHRAHPDPFQWIGLQDITSYVDFSAVAEVAIDMGFTLAGYTTQAHFLMAGGLDELMAASDLNDLARHMQLVQGVKQLTLPSEMGERFKVMGLVKGMKSSLVGFTLRDLQGRL